ncbi:MAG TPA: hypothetical protein VG841_15795 [Caulobacterales bacterium]|nr:hypothetical protein [Caulobacterales bacterium]
MPRQNELTELAAPLEQDVDTVGLQDFLDAMGSALVAGDDAAAAALWEMPAYAVSPDMAHVIHSQAQLQLMFAAARERYYARGVTDTQPEIVRLDEINDQIVMVRVHWPWIDGKGRIVGGETSTYTLQRDDEGDWKVRVAVAHGAEAVS